MLWSPLDRLLWGVVYIMCVIGGILYYQFGKEKESSTERVILYGFSALMFFSALGFFFFMLSELYLPGYYDYSANIFYGRFDLSIEEYNLFNRLGGISISLGFLSILLLKEQHMDIPRLNSIIAFRITASGPMKTLKN